MICAQVSPCPCTEFSDPRIAPLRKTPGILDALTCHLGVKFWREHHLDLNSLAITCRILLRIRRIECSLFCLLSKLYLRVIERTLCTFFWWFFIGPVHALRIAD
ncbi:hypothetical protein IV203_037304 [Nitzschia inconspicua]|uniref:Uncharacterized protein n=1 Tax=Nitzschia inconspicua TaxID=303405 RepID=A0A9K3LL35_9STRA|nr:hypothetical protein IV203_037304 [Nitzschia inconspicua]